MIFLDLSILCYVRLFFFFFKQKTAYELRISDWSSDVCSSDLMSRVSSGRRNGLGRRFRRSACARGRQNRRYSLRSASVFESRSPSGGGRGPRSRTLVPQIGRAHV